MPSFNLFEGSRRIALLLKIVWIVGVGVITFSTSPSVVLYFATQSPTDPFRIAKDNCEIGTDGVEFVSRNTGGEKSISAQLCFKAQTFSSNQQELVPYKIEKDTMWGNSPYSAVVQDYIKARAAQFTLSGADQQAAGNEWNRQWWRNVGTGVLVAVGGWIALSLLQGAIGWIVRGFLGIPWRLDSRPGPPSPGAEGSGMRQT